MSDFKAREARALNVLNDLIAAARKAGADAADAVLTESVSLGVSFRLGKPEDLERSESNDLGLRVLIGRRQAFVASTDCAPKALDELVTRAVAMARAAPEDKFCGLADPTLLATSVPDLDLADDAEPAPDALIARAHAAEESALAVTGVTNSEGAEASFGRGMVALATSGGFAGAYTGTRHGVSVSVLAGSGTAMERDYDFASARHLADLNDAAAVGRSAGERAVRRLNPRKLASRRMPVIFDARVAGSLIGHFAGAISGSAVARGTSFLKDRLEQPVFGAGIRIIDDPLRRRGLRSRPFDGEGIAARPLALIEDGRLTTWLLDSASARQLKLASNGRAARGTGGPPAPSTSNLWLEPGTKSVPELISDITEGLYITELIGFGVNPVTGDYSRGAAGFRIKNGTSAEPVSELTVAGNLKDMFRNLVPASDLVFRYGTDSPTVRIDGMTVAGT